MLKKGEFIIAYCYLYEDNPHLAEQVYEYANIRDKDMIEDTIQEYRGLMDITPITDDLKILYYSNKALFLWFIIGVPIVGLGIYSWIFLALITL